MRYRLLKDLPFMHMGGSFSSGTISANFSPVLTSDIKYYRDRGLLAGYANIFCGYINVVLESIIDDPEWVEKIEEKELSSKKELTVGDAPEEIAQIASDYRDQTIGLDEAIKRITEINTKVIAAVTTGIMGKHIEEFHGGVSQKES